MKKLIVILCLVTSLSACTKTETVIEMPKLPEITTPEAIPFVKPKGIVSVPDTRKYWINNKIDYDWNEYGSETLSNGTQFKWNAYAYYGLKDKTVETKINQSIKTMVDSFKSYADPNAIPAYPGLFRQYPKEEMVIQSIEVTTGAWFNYDNLLSIGVTAMIETQYPSAYEGYSGDFSYTITKTFDLNSGDEVHLSDLFVNETDYVDLLNELVLLDAVSKTDPGTSVFEQWWYQYRGGFKGIRGDIDFALSPDSLNLFFDQTYPEFSNKFSSTIVQIPYEKLDGVLAFQQRFASKSNLFTDTSVEKRDNYRTPISTSIQVVTKDKTTISSIITTDHSLSAFYAKIRDKLMVSDQALIDQAVKEKVDKIGYEFEASSVGPYMNVVSGLSFTDVSRGRTVTYKPDGSIFTFADAFKPGSDYKSIIIQKMKDIVTEHEEFTGPYDYEDIFSKMNIMIYGFQDFQAVRVFNRFAKAPALDEGTFDIMLELKEYQDILLVKPWPID